LSWDPPSSALSNITGYAVYLAVKNTGNEPGLARQQASQMAFVRVYGGVSAECSVNASQLQQTHLDTTTSSKPAIIFRIAARNERGYGPATQVRWLQDQQPFQNHTVNNTISKRTNTNNSGTNGSASKKQRLVASGGGAQES
jgi:host cell factor